MKSVIRKWEKIEDIMDSECDKYIECSLCPYKTIRGYCTISKLEKYIEKIIIKIGVKK